jgi:hypothetical protein
MDCRDVVSFKVPQQLQQVPQLSGWLLAVATKLQLMEPKLHQLGQRCFE